MAPRPRGRSGARRYRPDSLGPHGPGRRRAEAGIRIAKAAAEMAISVDAAAVIRVPEVTVSDVISDMSEGLGAGRQSRQAGASPSIGSPAFAAFTASLE